MRDLIRKLRALPVLLLGVLCAHTPAAARAAQEQGAAPAIVLLKLRDGSVRWGSIEEHDPEQLVFRRMDTGGLARLGWGFLDPGQERELRELFGYVDVSGEEIYTEAARIVMIDGQERIGLVVGRTEQALIVKDASAQIELPLARIRTVQAGLRVPARDIYTRAELYNQELSRTDLDDPEAVYELARFSERILEFQRALAHYEEVAARAPGFRPDELGFALERARVKAEQQGQLEVLDQADRLRRRQNYDQALALLVEFAAAYPDSPLQADRRRQEERVQRDRQNFLREEVRRRWMARTERVASTAARMDLQEVLSYVDEGFSRDVLAGVVEDVRSFKADITEDEVRQLWLERRKLRWRPASYGAATWLLGEDKALAGSQEPEPESRPMTAQDRERAALEERVRRFLASQESARRNSARAEDDGVDAESFWKSLSSSARRNWVLAYYAENAGDLEVRPRPELQSCPQCGGTGTLETIYTGGARSGESNRAGVRRHSCPTCHGIGSLRRIRYR